MVVAKGIPRQLFGSEVSGGPDIRFPMLNIS